MGRKFNGIKNALYRQFEEHAQKIRDGLIKSISPKVQKLLRLYNEDVVIELLRDINLPALLLGKKIRTRHASNGTTAPYRQRKVRGAVSFSELKELVDGFISRTAKSFTVHDVTEALNTGRIRFVPNHLRVILSRMAQKKEGIEIAEKIIHPVGSKKKINLYKKIDK